MKTPNATRTVQNDPTPLEAMKIAEEALGMNLQWLSDEFDLQIRQKDQDVIDRLSQLNIAWVRLAQAIANAEGDI